MNSKRLRYFSLGIVMALLLTASGCKQSPSVKYGVVPSLTGLPSATQAQSAGITSASAITTEGVSPTGTTTALQTTALSQNIAAKTPGRIEGIKINGKLTKLTFAADVIVPKVDAFPIIRVELAMPNIDKDAIHQKLGGAGVYINSKGSRVDILSDNPNTIEWETAGINKSKDGIAPNCSITAQAAIDRGQALLNALGLSDTKLYKVEAYGAGGAGRGFYRVFYQHFINGIGVTLEERFNDPYITAYGEPIVAMVADDDEVRLNFRVTQMTETVEENAKIISLEQAMDDLARQIDYVIVTDTDFVISRIALEYVPVDYSESQQTATYRPAWVFMSGDNIDTNMEFVAWIDAVTGELIQ